MEGRGSVEGLEHPEGELVREGSIGRVEHCCEREGVEHPVHRVERGEKNFLSCPFHTFCMPTISPCSLSLYCS